MKNNLLRVFFEWALIASVLMSAGFFVGYWLKSRQVRIAEAQIAAANEQFQRMNVVLNRLDGDCQEYAKSNPDFARFRASLMTPPPAPAATTKPVNTGTR